MVRLIPRETKFFDMFAEVADNLVAGARVLSDCLHHYDYERLPSVVEKIKEIEHHGDDMTHRILIKLNQTFITPFDREDIHQLASAIDDVADNIQGAANRMSLYRIDDFNEHIKKLSELILQCSTDLEKAVKELRDLKNVRAIADSCIRINSVENQADHVFDRAVADLFLYETDAIRLIKYKEILSSLETATDMCEDAANVMESILVKNA